MATEEDPKQQLHELLKHIVQQLQDNPSDELKAIFNQFVDEMPAHEKLVFMQEVLAVNGWQKVDESQWPKITELKTTPEPIKKPPSLAELQPPWVKYPTIPCYSIGWRMGYGEDYMLTWMGAIEQCDVDARIAYLKNYLPLPVSWLVWIASYCGHRTHYQNWTENSMTAVTLMEELGMGSLAEFKVWFDDDVQKKSNYRRESKL
jgi:hypothetical protein